MQARNEKENLFREAKWKHLRKHSLKEKKKKSAKKKNTLVKSTLIAISPLRE